MDDDFTLLQSWVSGDRRAGNQLIDRYYLEITRYFMTAVGDPEREELTQQTFEELCRAAPGFAGYSSFRTYLYRIAHNVFYGFLRAAYRRQRVFEDREFDATVHNLADIGQVSISRLISELVKREVMLQCLRELPVETKELLELFYWHDKTAKEIGEILNIPEGTVRSRAFTAKKTLRKKIDANSPALRDLDIDKQLLSLRQLLGFGPQKIDEPEDLPYQRVASS